MLEAPEEGREQIIEDLDRQRPQRPVELQRPHEKSLQEKQIAERGRIFLALDREAADLDMAVGRRLDQQRQRHRAEIERIDAQQAPQIEAFFLALQRGGDGKAGHQQKAEHRGLAAEIVECLDKAARGRRIPAQMPGEDHEGEEEAQQRQNLPWRALGGDGHRGSRARGRAAAL
nr:hypothetical protein [Methylosinus sp. LW4]